MKKNSKKITMYSLKNAKLAKKKNVKGFTLVELIVVIAIIGILAVVLVPNMMKYVKNASLSKANDAASKIAEQANLIAAEMEMEGKTLSGAYTADTDSFSLSGDSSADAFTEKLSKAVPSLDADSKVTIVFDETTGQVKAVAYAESDDAKYVGAYPDPVTLDDLSDGGDYAPDSKESSYVKLAKKINPPA
ncbi:MAG: type IV pilin protein [Porcipelethomonas sp.]